VRVLFCGKEEKLAGDALANRDAWVGIGGALDVIAEPDVAMLRAELAAADAVVDALFGTGLDRALTGFFATVVQEMDAARDRVVALDVPSGMDANTGMPLGAALHARDTVTFAHLKLGLATSMGAERAGRVTVVDIGVPESLYNRRRFQRAGCSSGADVASWLVPRGAGAHKGSAGRVLLIAGPPESSARRCSSPAARCAAAPASSPSRLSPTPRRPRSTARAGEMTARIDPARLEESLGTSSWEGANAVAIGPRLGHDAGGA